MKIYRKSRFHFSLFPFRSFFFWPCALLAKHFNIFSVLPTQPKAGRGVEAIEIADLELCGDDIAGGSKRAAGCRMWRGALCKVQVTT